MPQDSFYGMPVPGPRIDELPDVDAVNPSNGDTLVYNSTTKKWEHGTGSWVSSIYSKWDVDAPPASTGALDDEFQNSSLSVNWTEIDSAGRLTVTEDSWGLRFDYTAEAAHEHIAGLYKAIPAGDFTIITQISVGSLTATQWVRAGLALWENAADTAKDIIVLELYQGNTTSGIQVISWTSEATAGASSKFNVTLTKETNYIYLRVRYISGTTTYYFDFSSDGMTWYQCYSASAATIAFTPIHFGLFMSVSVAASKRAFFKFFRYLASDVGLLAPINGRRLTIGQGALAIIAAPLNPGQAIFTWEGILVISTGKIRIYNATGVSKTISRVTIAASTAPTGATIIVDIHKNGTTIFTNQANRPVIAVGTNMGYTTTIDIPAFADGDYITCDIDQVGSTITGLNMSVMVGYS